MKIKDIDLNKKVLINTNKNSKDLVIVAPGRSIGKGHIIQNV